MILISPSTTGTPSVAAAASPAAPAAASAFDAILALEALAATCAALDVSPLGGVALEGSPLEDLDRSERDSEDGEESEGEGPMAFLAGLLNVAMAVPPQTPSSAPQGGAGEETVDDVLSGAPHTPRDAAGALTPNVSASGLEAGAAEASSASGVAVANKLLTSLDAAAHTDVNAAEGATTQDSTSSLARAAEFLSQAPRHAAGVVRDTIPTPVHSPRWAEDLGARVTMMVRGAESSASLQLTPVDLGPVEVSVTVRDSQATVHFGASHADTRALLEASIPRLREMLAAQGFDLTDASVSQGFTRQARPDAPMTSHLNTDSEPEVVTTKAATLVGLLDTYA